jgi:hypothetical protein
VSDERLDDAIRDALLADDPGAVPVRLRARMTTIPDEAGGRRAASPWRQRLVTFALPSAILAAAVVVAMVFGGLAIRGQQAASVAPSTVPSPAPTSVMSTQPSGAPSPSSLATPAPSAVRAEPSGPITFQAGQVLALLPGTFAIRDGAAYQFNLIGQKGWPTISVNDPAGTQSVTYLVELKNGHDIASYALTDAGIVWIETWYTDKAITCNGTGCSPHMGQPVSWALNLTSFSGATAKLDSGVVSRTSVGGEASGPLPPEIAAQGGRVAYAVPRSNVQGMPEASQILVRSLPDGTLVRKIDTDGFVAQLGLFGQAIVYRDALNMTGDTVVDPGDTTLYMTTSDPETPTAVAEHVSTLAMGDGGSGPVRLAWTTSRPDDGAVHVAALDGSAPAAISPATPGQVNGFGPAVLGAGVVWTVQQQDSAGAWSGVVEGWRPGWANAHELASLGSPDAIGATGDQLLVSGGGIPALISDNDGAIPASALFGTTP